jgi:hypothetical protein
VPSLHPYVPFLGKYHMSHFQSKCTWPKSSSVPHLQSTSKSANRATCHFQNFLSVCFWFLRQGLAILVKMVSKVWPSGVASITDVHQPLWPFHTWIATQTKNTFTIVISKCK